MPNTVIGDIYKIKLANGNYVTIKDAKIRADFETLLGDHDLAELGAAAWQSVAASMTDAGLVSASTAKAYVDAQVASIDIGEIVIDQPSSESGHEGEPATEASATTYRKLYLVQSTTAAGSYVEWITIRFNDGTESSPEYRYVWERIGTTEIDLSSYVKKTQKIAGKALTGDITVSDLESALTLGDLAHADSASGSVSTIDAIEFNSMDVSGDIQISSTPTAATLTKGDYTPDGEVAAPVITLSSETVSVGNGLIGGSAASFTEGTFTPASLGTGFYTPGTTPSKAADTFTAGSFTKGNAVTAVSEGIVATVNETAEEGDDDFECLVFASAQTVGVMDYNATYVAPTFEEGEFNAGTHTIIDVSKFSGGSKAADTFTPNVVPTLATVTINNVSGATASAPEFTGAKAENILVTGVNYDKASGNSSFSQTITPTVKTFTRTSKTVTVTADAD